MEITHSWASNAKQCLYTKMLFRLHVWKFESSLRWSIYVRSIYEDGRIDVKLVASKTKVAPLKKQSIPRLQLLGATILVRLAKTVENALPQKLETVFWVDSMTVLCWNLKP